MVVESRTVNEILQTLDEYIADLRLYQQVSRDEVVDNRHHQSMIRYAFQTAIQCVIDVGNYILSANGFERPKDNKEVLLGLGRHGVIPEDFAKKISGMAGFRNILVHRYFKVDAELVYQHLQDGVDDFEQFSQYITDYLRGISGRSEC